MSDNAIARFDQTVGVSDEERKLAFANIKKAAKHYGVDMTEPTGTSWASTRAPDEPRRTAASRHKRPRLRENSTKAASISRAHGPAGLGRSDVFPVNRMTRKVELSAPTTLCTVGP